MSRQPERQLTSAPVIAFEHQRLPLGLAPAGIAITSEESSRLLAIAAARPGFCERGFDHVTLAQYCGVVSMGSRLLEVLPKTEETPVAANARGMLLRLLRLAYALPIHRDSTVGQSAVQSPLLEVFVSAFLDTVRDIVGGGLLVEYRDLNEDLEVVRGRIDFTTQLTRNANRRDRIACRYDDLTTNNEWNQIVKFGLWSTKPIACAGILSARWIELASAFVDVSERRFGLEQLRRLTFSRRAARYRPAIDWIRLLVQLLSPDLRAGSYAAAPGLLFDMNKLFEQAVANHLFAQLPAGISLTAQENTKTLARVVDSSDDCMSQVQPDLVLRRGEQVVAVGDTKWKRLDVNKAGFLVPNESDLYQALAYAATYRCDSVALIYPWHSGLIGSRETTLEIAMNGSATRVSIVCLDLRTHQLPAVRGARSPVFQAMQPTNAA